MQDAEASCPRARHLGGPVREGEPKVSRSPRGMMTSLKIIHHTQLTYLSPKWSHFTHSYTVTCDLSAEEKYCVVLFRTVTEKYNTEGLPRDVQKPDVSSFILKKTK